jgi:hypothetical protein
MQQSIYLEAMEHFGVDDMAALMEVIEAQNADDVCDATDGCRVEPDGRCPHGCSSWLVELGLI